MASISNRFETDIWQTESGAPSYFRGCEGKEGNYAITF